MQYQMQDKILNCRSVKHYLHVGLVQGIKSKCLMKLGCYFVENVNPLSYLESTQELDWEEPQLNRSEYLAISVGMCIVN